MQQLFPNIYTTPVEYLTGPVTKTGAYFITTDNGNVLIGNYSLLKEHFDWIIEQGGINTHITTGKAESLPISKSINETFNCSTYLHPDDAAGNDLFDAVPLKLPSTIEHIPTPGQTPGSCMIMFSNTDDKQYLFTGSTLYCSNGNWQTDISGGDRQMLLDSFHYLNKLAPDVILCNLSVNKKRTEEITRIKWQAILDACTSRLNYGLYH